MSIKLFDDYHSYRPSPSTAPGNNDYGTLLAFYGRNNHWEHNLYFGANKRIYYRMAAYTTWAAEDGSLGGYHYWRTILDSKSDVESSGLLKLSGNGNHYILNGNFGIGTNLSSNPNNYKLAVNGTIGAKEVKVEITSSTWSDFVFAKEYELPTLQEVERHIQENGHLKDIPSAKDVEKNGINLGEMDAKLLQKIEELTLYIIEQNNKIEDLQNQIDELKN